MARAKKTVETKELKIIPDGMGMYSVGFEGGGEVPAKLSGKYNSKLFAQMSIDTYLTNRK